MFYKEREIDLFNLINKAFLLHFINSSLEGPEPRTSDSDSETEPQSSGDQELPFSQDVLLHEEVCQDGHNRQGGRHWQGSSACQRGQASEDYREVQA